MGRIIAFLCAVLLAMPAQAAWHEATTKHFRLYSEGNPESLRSFASKVERFDAFLRNRLNVGDEANPQRLTIFILRSSADVARVGGMGKNVAGFYSPAATGSIAVIHRDRADGKFDLGGDVVLFHEYAHHFMYRYFPFAYPLWYSEGFAEYVSTISFTREGQAEIGKPPYYRAYGLTQVSPIPAPTLIASDARGKSAEQVDAFYGWSWMLTHFLNHHPSREGQLSAYLKAINAGTPNMDAAKTAFGDLDQLSKDLRSYRDKASIGFRQEVRTTPIPGDIILRTLSEAEGVIVMHRLAIMREPNSEEARTIVTALAPVVAKAPSAEGWRLLADAQFSAEQFDAADASADKALLLAPALSRAMMVKANVAIRRYATADIADPALAKSMRSWVIKANRADPNDPLPLIAYHRLFALTGENTPQLAIDGLRRAFEMVPESGEVRMAYVNALATAQKWDEAIRLTKPVAFAPHSGNASEAQAFLARLEKAKAGDVDALEALR
jgi:tetratricopeptide (TPR) repeat protein